MASATHAFHEVNGFRAHVAECEVGFAEGSGHFVHCEEPDLAAAAIRGFFTGRT